MTTDSVEHGDDKHNSDQAPDPAFVTIALDAMSGDLGAATSVEAAQSALKAYADIRIILVGDEAVLSPLLGKASPERLSVHHASEVVTMEETAAVAMRSKKDSSMRVAINLVQQGAADACVSCGNTGALMGTAKFVLKTLSGVDRPAICTALPTAQGSAVQMLDLGANVDSTAEQLYQFAVMGSALAAAVGSKPAPRVGLLNIGSEDIKGNIQVRETDKLLQQANLNYIGFVEGDELYQGDVDVVVADGFVGNVALKTTEGAARLITGFMRDEFTRSPLNKLMALAAKPVLNRLKKRIDPRLYNGASLLGLRGLVVKSHGSADAFAIENAINVARVEAQEDLVATINVATENLLNNTVQIV